MNILSLGKGILANKYDPNFPLKHAQKDMRLALELASSAGVDLPVSSVVNEQFKKGLAAHADDDFSAVHLTYKENK
jgi:3-hydroxyisobutyrate dehydrogenase-like beta-hydroxyacid dehydrogenase